SRKPRRRRARRYAIAEGSSRYAQESCFSPLGRAAAPSQSWEGPTAILLVQHSLGGNSKAPEKSIYSESRPNYELAAHPTKSSRKSSLPWQGRDRRSRASSSGPDPLRSRKHRLTASRSAKPDFLPRRANVLRGRQGVSGGLRDARSSVHARG